MLEKTSPNQTAASSTSSPTTNLDSNTTGATVGAVKRYTPPNQRNRSNNRRKSSSSAGDQVDQMTNLYVNDVEKNPGASSRNVMMDPGDAGSSNLLYENQYSGIVDLQGCSHSAASCLLNDRWNAAVQLYNSLSIESPDKPVMHLGGTAAWSNFRLPHQIIAHPGSNSGMQLDFLAELNRAMLNADASFSS